jgi:hypothetical protein
VGKSVLLGKRTPLCTNPHPSDVVAMFHAPTAQVSSRTGEPDRYGPFPGECWCRCVFRGHLTGHPGRNPLHVGGTSANRLVRDWNLSSSRCSELQALPHSGERDRNPERLPDLPYGPTCHPPRRTRTSWDGRSHNDAPKSAAMCSVLSAPPRQGCVDRSLISYPAFQTGVYAHRAPKAVDLLGSFHRRWTIAFLLLVLHRARRCHSCPRPCFRISRNHRTRVTRTEALVPCPAFPCGFMHRSIRRSMDLLGANVPIGVGDAAFDPSLGAFHATLFGTFGPRSLRPTQLLTQGFTRS